MPGPVRRCDWMNCRWVPCTTSWSPWSAWACSSHTYLPESFPTSVRGTASGTTYSLSKLSTAVQPFLLLPLLDRRGPGAVFTVITVALVTMVVIIGLWGPISGRKPLDAE